MPRGRRVNSNGERSKQLLLTKAIELFSIHGYYETKISDIVKAADLTQPTFYLYFQSKESLYKDLNEQFKNDFFAIVNKEFESTKNEVENFQLRLVEIFKFFLNNPFLTKIAFYDSEYALLLKEELSNNLVDWLQNKGKVFVRENMDTKIYAESLIGALERLTLSKLVTGKRGPEQLASDIVNIFFVTEKEPAL
nr:TetR/AcrR family transcriptional regulator [Lysinibacillus timonensis]